MAITTRNQKHHIIAITAKYAEISTFN